MGAWASTLEGPFLKVWTPILKKRFEKYEAQVSLALITWCESHVLDVSEGAALDLKTWERAGRRILTAASTGDGSAIYVIKPLRLIMNIIKMLQSERVVRTAEGLHLVPSAKVNGESRAPREGGRAGRCGAGCKKEKEGCRKYNMLGGHGASPSEGDLPGECPDTLWDQDLSVDRPIPEAVIETTPSGHAVLNGHSTAPPCPAAAAENSETTGHIPAPCANAPSSAVLAETSVTTQEQCALSAEHAAVDSEGKEMLCCRATLTRCSAAPPCPADPAETPEAALGSDRKVHRCCSHCKAPNRHCCEIPCTCGMVHGRKAGVAILLHRALPPWLR
ncbi:uncharacterized protein LOC119704909 [Motacilla alba alba]|uniref:uncharacterized protein LOC119704909 n=1 Tax=Motacilla alba alba TaxID=1094192 RepID=UPI0018D5705E|nr:uncharacterized protein LOC119704909 [Motacilla alba alba]